VTFVAGVAIGFGAAALLHRHGTGPGGHRRGPERMLSRLTHDLNLTPAQHDSVRVVLEQHWTAMSALWDSTRPRFDSLRAALDSAVVRQLTPEQQTKYRERLAKHRHFEERRGPGGGSRRHDGGRP
jgi:hypothetical protein